jgi:hypothetical protein
MFVIELRRMKIVSQKYSEDLFLEYRVHVIKKYSGEFARVDSNEFEGSLNWPLMKLASTIVVMMLRSQAIELLSFTSRPRRPFWYHGCTSFEFEKNLQEVLLVLMLPL